MNTCKNSFTQAGSKILKRSVLICVAIVLTTAFKTNAQTGNVGVGTNSPQAKLHVNGDARIDSLPTTVNANQVLVLDTLTDNLALRPYPVIDQSTETLVRIFAKTNGNSIPNSSATNVTYNTTSVNTLPSSWNQATGTFTAPRDGLYKISASLLYAQSSISNNEFSVGITKNGTVIAANGNFDYMTGASSYKPTGQVEAIVELSTNDIINIETFQTAGSTQTLNSNDKWSYINIEELPNTATTATSTVTHYVTEGDATFGDIKQGVQPGDHAGWVKLDGRLLSTLTSTQQSAATTLGFSGNLPNASNAYLSQNGNTLGSLSGSNSTTIAQNNLPNVTLSGNTSTDGDHNHNFSRPRGDQAYANGSGTTWWGTTNGVSVTTSNSGSHSHTITTSSINGGVTQQSLYTAPRTMSVNTFIYLGN